MRAKVRIHTVSTLFVSVTPQLPRNKHVCKEHRKRQQELAKLKITAKSVILQPRAVPYSISLIISTQRISTTAQRWNGANVTAGQHDCCAQTTAFISFLKKTSSDKA